MEASSDSDASEPQRFSWNSPNPKKPSTAGLKKSDSDDEKPAARPSEIPLTQPSVFPEGEEGEETDDDMPSLESRDSDCVCLGSTLTAAPACAKKRKTQKASMKAADVPKTVKTESFSVPGAFGEGRATVVSVYTATGIEKSIVKRPSASIHKYVGRTGMPKSFASRKQQADMQHGLHMMRARLRLAAAKASEDGDKKPAGIPQKAPPKPVKTGKADSPIDVDGISVSKEAMAVMTETLQSDKFVSFPPAEKKSIGFAVVHYKKCPCDNSEHETDTDDVVYQATSNTFYVTRSVMDDHNVDHGCGEEEFDKKRMYLRKSDNRLIVPCRTADAPRVQLCLLPGDINYNVSYEFAPEILSFTQGILTGFGKDPSFYKQAHSGIFDTTVPSGITVRVIKQEHWKKSN